jgi:hypothetical protein
MVSLAFHVARRPHQHRAGSPPADSSASSRPVSYSARSYPRNRRLCRKSEQWPRFLCFGRICASPTKQRKREREGRFRGESGGLRGKLVRSPMKAGNARSAPRVPRGAQKRISLEGPDRAARQPSPECVVLRMRVGTGGHGSSKNPHQCRTLWLRTDCRRVCIARSSERRAQRQALSLQLAILLECPLCVRADVFVRRLGAPLPDANGVRPDDGIAGICLQVVHHADLRME